MTEHQDQFRCPHCGAMTLGPPEFCPACGRRLTVVRPPSRFAGLVRALRFLRPSDPLGRDPKGVGEAYKHGPMNHSEGGV